MEPYPPSMVSHISLRSSSQQMSARDRHYRVYCILIVLTIAWFFILGSLVGITIYASASSASFSFPVYVVIVWAIVPPVILQFWRRRSAVFRMTIKRRKPKSKMPEFDTMFKPATPCEGELCPICLGDMSDSISIPKSNDGDSRESKVDSVESEEKASAQVKESSVVQSVYCSHKFDRDCANIYINHWGPTAVDAKGDVICCPVCRSSWAPGVNPEEEVGCDSDGSFYYYVPSSEGSRDDVIVNRV